MKHFLTIRKHGIAERIYDESVELKQLGQPIQYRASHIDTGTYYNEIDYVKNINKWYADIGPIGGPFLGPFNKRSEALAAEVKWLEENYLMKGLT